MATDTTTALEFPRFTTTRSGKTIRYRSDVLNGRKIITYENHDRYEVKECPVCQGDGRYYAHDIQGLSNERCESCNGSGEIETFIDDEE